MKKIEKAKDSLSLPVIYVQECDRFSFEYQKDLPKLNQRHTKKVYIKSERLPDMEKYNNMYKEKNYSCNSGK